MNRKARNLLDDDGDSEVQFKVNNSYAERYDTWRRKEELQKFKDRYGKDALDASEDEITSSSSEDEDSAEEVNEVFDKDFYRTLACLKAKDPKIYDKQTKFFDDAEQSQKNKEGKKEKKIKPIYLRDYERKIILEKGGIFSDEEQAEEINQDFKRNPKEKSYYEEQEAIKESFKTALLHDDEKDSDGNPIGGLFSKKMKSSEEKAREDDEYAAWLQGQNDKLKSEEEEKGLAVLRSYWTDPSLDPGEAFLRDYILQKRFIPKGKARKVKEEFSPVEADNESLEGDEEELEKMEEFEHKFNFRFEEPDQEFIKRYPRTLDSTLRKKDDRRKTKREEIRSRKEAEKQQHKEELRKAKELKAKEIEERIQKLCTITGNPELAFKGEDLDTDFDPHEHDRRMKELFAEDTFYTTAEHEKPEFPELDEELDIEEWDNWNAGEDMGNAESGQYDNGLHCDDPNFNMDCEYDTKAEFQKSMIEACQGKRAKKRERRRRGANTKLADGLKKGKPVFDPMDYISKVNTCEPTASEAFEKYVDEYYGLDFEDVIGGDLPCRFKYRKVTPNDYGLSVEEILNADDKELNRWCSLKKALKIKPEEKEKYDLQAYRKKGANIRLKKKIFNSMYTNPAESSDVNEFKPTKKRRNRVIPADEFDVQNQEDLQEDMISNNICSKEDVETIPEESQVKSKKKIKNIEESDIKSVTDNQKGDKPVKRKRKRKSKQVIDREDDIGSPERKKANLNLTSNENKKRKVNKQHSSKESYLSSIPKSRLKAYGINPKKFKNKLKYKPS